MCSIVSHSLRISGFSKPKLSPDSPGSETESDSQYEANIFPNLRQNQEGNVKEGDVNMECSNHVNFNGYGEFSAYEASVV